MENIFSCAGPIHPWAIIAEADERRHYVVTDNLSGWLDMWTGPRRFQGEDTGGSYMVTDRVALRGWEFSNHKATRDSVLREEIYPWGSRRLYLDGTREAMVLWSGRRILSVGHDAQESPDFLVHWSPDAIPDSTSGLMTWYPQGISEEERGDALGVRAKQDRATLEGEGGISGVRAISEGLSGVGVGRVEGGVGVRANQVGVQPELFASVLRTSRDGWTWHHIIFGTSSQDLAQNRDIFLVDPARDPLDEEIRTRMGTLDRLTFSTDKPIWDKALWWAKASARSLVVNEFGPGIWAGLPWFKDNWGRDTFIALPGTLLVQGEFALAREVLENFARFQNLDREDPHYGRIPNRVNRQEILYNTVDGTPWLIREVYEYLLYTGDRSFALGMLPMVERYLEGATKYWVDEYGLLCHDHADTWMDARIEGKAPWSPRGNRASEIQILFQTALWVGSELSDLAGKTAQAAEYRALAEQSRTSFLKFFVHQGRIVDHIREDGSPDLAIRPNVLMLAWIPFQHDLPEELLRSTWQNSLETLLLPWGIMSLDPASPNFHPRHESKAFHHKDAAYHNGTIWGWNAGFAVGALCRLGAIDRAWELSENLAGQILNQGTAGTMSELLDAVLGPDGKPKPSGTFSQAWSVSEFARNAIQDYLGFQPDLLHQRLVFAPSLPPTWHTLIAKLPLGLDGLITVEMERRPAEAGKAWVEAWSFSGIPLGLELYLEYRESDGQTVRYQLPGTTHSTVELAVWPLQADLARAPEPDPHGIYLVESGFDVLRKKIECQENGGQSN